jgi:hypothetical protein
VGFEPTRRPTASSGFHDRTKRAGLQGVCDVVASEFASAGVTHARGADARPRGRTICYLGAELGGWCARVAVVDPASRRVWASWEAFASLLAQGVEVLGATSFTVTRWQATY